MKRTSFLSLVSSFNFSFPGRSIKSILKKLLDVDDSKDFALNELSLIQKRKCINLWKLEIDIKQEKMN